jgi:hypothetical protein
MSTSYECPGKVRNVLSAEALERNDAVKRLERIALGANRLETLVEIVETQLPHGIPPPGQSSRNTEADLPGPPVRFFEVAFYFAVNLASRTWIAAPQSLLN